MDEAQKLTQLLQQCELEQLHHSSAIQPFGVLLAVDSVGGSITHASENASALLHRPLTEIIGQAADQILGFDIAGIRGVKDGGTPRTLPCIRSLGSGVVCEVTLIPQKDRLLIELEPTAEPGKKDTDLFSVLRFFKVPEAAAEVMALHRNAAQTIQDLTGFEKVMIYRFHDDWSGEVITELSRSEAFDSYLGLRFPASDIPRIARKLYEQNAYRLISDVSQSPEPILGETENGILDLTHADLRSVSPVHIQYLKNMGVGASFSLSIMVRKQLWGLIACHHPTPRHLSLETRAQCAKTADYYALALSTWLTGEKMRFLNSVGENISDLLARSSAEASLCDKIRQGGVAWLQLTEATGGAYIDGYSFVPFGTTPPETAIREIDAWFIKHCPDPTLITTKLMSLFPAAEAWRDWASGLIGVKLAHPKSHNEPRFYWFRPELPQQIHWAGNPDKRASSDPTQEMISPRKSFESWTETTFGQSEDWGSGARLAADTLRKKVLLPYL
ncbi:hypothetical protein JCM17960_14450 [Magnetospira thiophila]